VSAGTFKQMVLRHNDVAAAITLEPTPAFAFGHPLEVPPQHNKGNEHFPTATGKAETYAA
jgi:hypothetical protein